MDSSGLVEAFRALIGALRDAGVEFAVIGALARGAWAEPRATTDLDVQVAMGRESWPRARRALEARGFGLVRETPPK